jgi:hypothetical protein
VVKLPVVVADQPGTPSLISRAENLHDLQNELAALSGLRRRMMAQLGMSIVLTPPVVLLLWDAELVVADTRWLAAAGIGLLSWVVVRTVVYTASVLEAHCPACGEPFLGGLARVGYVLSIPPTECVSCQIGLDGRRDHGAGSRRGPGQVRRR